MRYFFGFLITTGLIILLIVMMFRGGSDKKDITTSSKSLISYAATGSSVSMSVEGPINADEDHQQYSITVDRNNVVFEKTEGYEGKVVDRKTYENNQDSYYNFLKALTRADFTNGNNDKALKDETSLCPLGSRYVFKLEQGGEDIERYWVTTCTGTKTYLGNFTMTQNLFALQVPDLQSLTSDFVATAD